MAGADPFVALSAGRALFWSERASRIAAPVALVESAATRSAASPLGVDPASSARPVAITIFASGAVSRTAKAWRAARTARSVAARAPVGCRTNVAIRESSPSTTT